MELKKEKDSGIKDNIQMHYQGLGRVESKTTWSNNGKKKTIPELQDCLIEIIKLTKQWHVPDEPPTTAPQRIEMPIGGKLFNSVKELYWKAKYKETESTSMHRRNFNGEKRLEIPEFQIK